jgi:hypothetical protein
MGCLTIFALYRPARTTSNGSPPKPGKLSSWVAGLLPCRSTGNYPGSELQAWGENAMMGSIQRLAPFDRQQRIRPDMVFVLSFTMCSMVGLCGQLDEGFAP